MSKFSRLEKDEKNNKAFVETDFNLEKRFDNLLFYYLSTKTQRNNKVVSFKRGKLSLVADIKNMPLIFQ